jgi:hypothetical protein
LLAAHFAERSDRDHIAGPSIALVGAVQIWRIAMCSNKSRMRIAGSRECAMDELNGRMIACQILVAGLIARVANDSRDPLSFLTDFRDEIKAVVNGINIVGMQDANRVRQTAQKTVDELFSLMKPPSTDPSPD